LLPIAETNNPFLLYDLILKFAYSGALLIKTLPFFVAVITFILFVFNVRLAFSFKESDALLLIHPSNGRKGIFTGKLFEYLGVLKPIGKLAKELKDTIYLNTASDLPLMMIFIHEGVEYKYLIAPRMRT